MSKCKVINISVDDKRRIELGTVDKEDAKSFYITISAWVNPKKDLEPNQITRDLRLRLSRVLNKNKLSPTSFLDLDLRESGLRLGKKSFMTCEMTFLGNKLPFNSIEMVDQVNDLLNDLDNEVMSNNENFIFTARK